MSEHGHKQVSNEEQPAVGRLSLKDRNDVQALLTNEALFSSTNEAELTERTLESISHVLDRSSVGRQEIWNHRTTLYDKLLCCMQECIKSQHLSSNRLRLHSCVRAVMKLEQHYHADWVSERKSHLELTERIYAVITSTIHNSCCPTESGLLAGTALAFFLHTLPSVQIGCALFIDALVQADDSFMEHSDVITKLKNLSVGSSVALQQLQMPKILKPGVASNIYLFYGLFACGKIEIPSNSVQSGMVISNQSLALVSYQSLEQLCRDCKCNSYMAFQAMVVWLKFVHKNLAQLCETDYWKAHYPIAMFDSKSTIVWSLINLLEVNWESPIVGVSGLVWDAYQLILDIHILEARSLNAPNFDMMETLFLRLVSQPWTLKAKYPPLAIIIPYLGTEKVMAVCSSFCENILESLASNPLAAAGNQVYKALLRQLGKECEDVSYKSLEYSWKEICLAPLIASLCHHSSTVRHNATRHWLPTTLREYPASFDHLLAELITGKNSNCLLAVGCLLHLARQQGICDITQVDNKLLRICLSCHDEDTRIEVFAFLCLSHKRAESLSESEACLLKEFLPLNLNIDNSAFRQHLTSNLKSLLVRIRDSCLRLLKDGYQEGEDFLRAMLFTDWLHELLIQNLSTGACYQRKQTCLLLLNVLISVFCVDMSTIHQRKGALPEKTPGLLAYFKSQSKCDLFSGKTQFLLLICITDYMNQIQKQALSIWNTYFFQGSDAQCLTFDDQVLLNYALKLCSSPKTMQSESGVVFCQLIFHRVDLASKMQLTEKLIQLLKNQLSTARENMLIASQREPMHGLISALTHFMCIFGPLCVTEDLAAMFRQLVEDCLQLSQEVMSHVCCVLASKSSTKLDDEFSPSFGEIGEAIDDIVSSVQLEDGQAQGMETHFSHQLVSACCWLSLKESATMIGMASQYLPVQKVCNDRPYLITHKRMLDMGHSLLAVLSKCRHKGVIDACHLAFQMFCETMLNPKALDLKSVDFIEGILKGTLSGIATAATKTSVTRKSAGLPALILAIVTSDRSAEKRFLKLVITQLLDLVQEPLPELVIDITDLSQTHALHILRLLVHDARLSQDMFFYLEDVTITCLDCFLSPSWAIRNAILQLFGAIVPRLVGQKKVSDDSAVHNAISFNEFLTRYPKLSVFVYELLQKTCIQPVPIVILPILSLIGRMSPDAVANQGFEKLEPGRNPEDFAPLLWQYLESSIFHIKKMASKALVMLTSANERYGLLVRVLDSIVCPVSTWNQLHGFALLVIELLINLGSNGMLAPLDQDMVFQIQMAFGQFVKFSLLTSVPPFLKAVFVDILINAPSWLQLDLASYYTHHISSITCHSKWMPGYSLWIQRLTCLHLKQLRICEAILETIRILDDRHIIDGQCEACLQFLRLALLRNVETGHSINDSVWMSVQNCLVNFLDVEGMYDQRHACLQLILSIHFKFHISPDRSSLERLRHTAENLAIGNQGASVISTALAVWAIAISTGIKNQMDFDTLGISTWSELLVKHSSPRLVEPFRLMAAKALSICGADFYHALVDASADGPTAPIGMKLGIRILQASLTLLQDEQLDIRKQASCFVTSLYDINDTCLESVHPNLGIRMLGAYIVKFFSKYEEVSHFLWNSLCDGQDLWPMFMSTTFLDHSSSLFQQDEINVYAEKCLMNGYYAALLKMTFNDKKKDVVEKWGQARLGQVTNTCYEVIAWLEPFHKPGIQCLEIVSQTKVAPSLAGLLCQLDVLQFIYESSAIGHSLTLLHDKLYKLVGFNWLVQLPSILDFKFQLK